MGTFKCEICGNIVKLIHNGGGTLVCCGQEMVEQTGDEIEVDEQ